MGRGVTALASRRLADRSCAEAARRYAQERSWAVLPIRPGTKVPATGHGLHDATTDLDVIAAWWRRWPRAAVAIRTGGVSGLFVVDVDKRHGGWDSVGALDEADRWQWRTARVLTPTGGAHFYFRHPGGLPNSAGKLGAGIDTRGEGGYVLAPPSPHPDGGRYAWQHELTGGVGVGVLAALS